MKNWYKVTIKATITKTQDVQAGRQDEAEREAMELFNPHSGEAEERYTQEVVDVQWGPATPEKESILMEAALFALQNHYEDLAEHLDLSDEVLQPIKEQLDKHLND